MERAKGFEPSTPTLARSCSTPELHPHPWVTGPEGGHRPQAMPNDMRLCNRRGAATPLTARPRAIMSSEPLFQPSPPMPATPDDLFALLDRLGITHRTVSHPPLFTVEQS